MSAGIHGERVARGRSFLAQYAEADGGSLNDPDAWMHASAAIADILHALDFLAADGSELGNEYQGDVERVLNLARMHYEEERESVAERASVESFRWIVSPEQAQASGATA
jgi:hypothetical protein